MLGAIEAGGTKFVCGVGTEPADLKTIQIPTTTPERTVTAAIAFLREESGGRLDAIGIASFGPVDLRCDSPTYGYITSTPKAGWENFDLAGAIRRAFRVPVGFDTDVNGAALGESRWGAAKGLSDFVYLTVGTGIGGGAMARGRILHGMMHPEMGHIRVPRDRGRDPFNGCCRYHGDCLEGLASGPAIELRCGVDPSTLPPDDEAWKLEAHYLGLALNNFACALSPQRFVLGGGVMDQRHLFPMIRAELEHLVNGYIRVPEEYVVPAALGSRAGVLGALVLAEMALEN
jgi:fructokinase